MKTLTILVILIFSIHLVHAQNVGINVTGANPDESAILDIDSDGKGILIPRMTTSERTLIVNPADGLMVYDTDFDTFWYYANMIWSPVGYDNLGNHTANSNLKMELNKVTGLGFPTNIRDATPKGYVDIHEDADANAANELISTISLNGTDLEVMEGGVLRTADLSALSNSGFINVAGVVQNSGDNASNDFVFGAEEIPTTAISDTLLFFDKSKGAFRVGMLSNSVAWNDIYVGIGSFGSGRSTVASGECSFASGLATVASASYSTAFGVNAKATELYSFAAGRWALASGESSFAGGSNTEASGESSTAFGAYTEALGDYSIAIGYGNDATEDLAIAFGDGTKAGGVASFAWGRFTEANGFCSVAGGFSNVSDGYGSFAMGSNSGAYGDHSAVFGSNCFANENRSFSSGLSNNSNAPLSVTFGDHNIANGYASFVLGQYCDSILFTPQSSPTFSTPYLIVGNGSSDAIRSNAFVVRRNGDSEFDRNLIPMIDDHSNLGSLSRRFNNIYATNGTIQTSDLRVKKNIEKSPYGLKDILNLNPMIYHWNTEEDVEKKHIGLIAQELLKVIPEVVNEPKNSDDLLGVKYAELTPVLIQAIKELHAENNRLNKSIVEQNAKMTKMEATLLSVMDVLELNNSSSTN